MQSSALQANMAGTSNPAVRPQAGPGLHRDQHPVSEALPGKPLEASRPATGNTENAQLRRKTRILVDATRHFCDLPRARYGDVEQYKELFYQLIGTMPPSDRRIVSAMLARNPYAPRQVALYLALDRIEIAAPFLMFSPVLTKRDLEKIVDKRGLEYAQVIARRQQETKAFFEQPDFSELSKRDKAPDPLLQIRRAPEETATSRSIASAVRSLSQAAPESADITEAPREHYSSAAAGEMLAIAGRGGRLGRNRSPALEPAAVASGQQAELASAPETSPLKADAARTQELRLLARRRDLAGFAHAVELAGGPQADVTQKLIKAKTGDELLYLIRALAIPFPEDRQIAMLLAPRYGRTPESYYGMGKLLDELNTDICRMIFNEIGANFGHSRKADVATSGDGIIAQEETVAGLKEEENASELPEFRQAAHERRQRLNKLIGSERQPQFGHRRSDSASASFGFGS